MRWVSDFSKNRRFRSRNLPSMKRLLLLLLLSLPLAAQTPKLDSLAWLTGQWTLTDGGELSEEVWLAPAGGIMLGLHRDAKGDRANFEFLRIEVTKDGIVFFAQPSGRPPTPFKLVESTKNRAVFANPQHDFPKRIIYFLKDAQLCARVEGDEGGEQAMEWCWNRR
jgi:hypothetical protein